MNKHGVLMTLVVGSVANDDGQLVTIHHEPATTFAGLEDDGEYVLKGVDFEGAEEIEVVVGAVGPNGQVRQARRVKAVKQSVSKAALIDAARAASAVSPVTSMTIAAATTGSLTFKPSAEGNYRWFGIRVNTSGGAVRVVGLTVEGRDIRLPAFAIQGSAPAGFTIQDGVVATYGPDGVVAIALPSNKYGTDSAFIVSLSNDGAAAVGASLFLLDGLNGLNAVTL